MAKELYSLQIEKHVLGGLIKNPQIFADISSILSEQDFYQPVHKTIYSVINSAYSHGESKLDGVLLAQKVKDLGISFKDDINIFDYVDAISFSNITPEACLKACKNLIKYRIRRELVDTGKRIIENATDSDDKPIAEILTASDKIYNDKISQYEGKDKIVNLFSGIKDFCINRASNQIEEIGLTTPFKSFNHLFGGIRSGNGVYAICSRPKQGKSTFLLEMAKGCIKLNKNLKVLYLDTEMQDEVSKLRGVSAATGIPMWWLETGKWINSPEYRAKFDKHIAKCEELDGKFFHHTVCDKPIDEICSIIRRWFLKEVGRDGTGMVMYDYIKLTGETITGNWSEHQAIGEKITQLNKVGVDLNIPIWTACQLNRSAEDGVDDSSAIAISDRLQWYAAFVAIFRRKREEEFLEWGIQSGSHLLKPTATRFQGKDATGHNDLVKLPKQKGQRKPRFAQNFINFNVENFAIEDRGTLSEMASLRTSLKETSDDEPTVLV